MISNEQVSFLIHQLNAAAEVYAETKTFEAKLALATAWGALVQHAEPGLLSAATDAADWLCGLIPGEPGDDRANDLGTRLRNEVNAVGILPDVTEG